MTLVDTLPTGSNFVFAAPETCVLQPPGAVSCELGALQAGESRTAVLVLTLTLPVTLTNTATVSSLAPDSNPANNTATQETAVSCVSAGSHTLAGRIRADKKSLARVTVTLKGADHGRWPGWTRAARGGPALPACGLITRLDGDGDGVPCDALC